MAKAIEIVIKDGNRTVNWLTKDSNTLDKVLAEWSKGYHAFKRDTVRLNGRRLLETHLECKVRYFAEKYGKLVFQVETVWPKKEDSK